MFEVMILVVELNRNSTELFPVLLPYPQYTGNPDVLPPALRLHQAATV